ncbi:MAG TPA: non-ribosomal peptide synthetase, partial [Cyanobacteria bacterium UBA8553]|nr:non-ribosomal peptide synthetase [Cyanobacteria bacterium UBA8553]
MQQEITSGFRLSPQQKRLWLLQQADSTQPYRVQFAILIEGNLDRKCLKTALENAVNRHEILRTTFHGLPGMNLPLQVIGDTGIAWVIDCNFSGLDASEQTDKLEALWDELHQVPFDFEKGSLMQVSLVKLSSQEWVLFISLPALCADAIALEKLIHELSRSYVACFQDKELSDEPLQYADLAEWQNELLESDEWQAGREYWRQQDILSPLTWKLPLENQPHETLDFHPRSFDLTVPSPIASQIEILSQHHKVSISSFLVTCWQILLWKLIMQPDILVGIACNGRKYEGLDDALGLFLRYLPLQINLKENYHFIDVLKQVNELVQDILTWQEYFTWEQITTGNEQGNLPSFFPFCFEFEELFPQKIAADVTFSIHKRYACTDRFKLKLICRLQDKSLTTEFHYDANVFSTADIRCLAEQFSTLLANTSQHPEAQLSELEIISDIERYKLLVEFNNTRVDYPQNSCIHHLFEEQVTRTPNNIAVVFENQQLTYAQLNARANQLAGYLRRRGVGLEVPVAICMERSIEMVVGLLGILKAGGAYVPLDATYPKERLAFILEDTQTPILLTQKHLLATLPNYLGQTICLESDWEEFAPESEENLASSVTADHLAYIIYTSGSTGKPKGVLVTHGNLVHSTRDRITFYRQPIPSFLLLSSVAFDSSVAGLFWTLCQGGSLVLPPDGVQREIPQLLDLLAHHRISHLLSLPSLYALLLEQANSQQLVSLQTVIVAGESCTQELVERHYQCVPQASLFNEYGPTEGTVWSSVYPCPPKELRLQVPIGRPIANTQIYLLDSRLQPVPIGVAGELYISGLGLARGYLNQPELTAQRFIPNPFSNEPGARLYKTGDLARYRTDGSIEFLGRCDRQIKRRGFRVELGEIEAVLTQHRGISEAVVSDWDDESGTKRLVAYIVTKPESTPTTNELHQFLLQQLPQYMVPSNIMLLSALPRLPNGKVNRKALPAPETAQPKTYVAPRTALEKLLTDIWVQVLGLEQVGIHDNFFELGGDSILSIQIIAKANQAGFQFTTKQLFERPTIAELSTVCGTQTIQAEQGLITGSIPLIPIQHWFFNQNLTDPHHWNQVVLLEVPSDLNLTFIEPAFRSLLRHHDVLRLRFEQTVSGWQQVNASPDDIVPITQYDLSTLASEEQAPAIEATATQLHESLNLSTGPL